METAVHFIDIPTPDGVCDAHVAIPVRSGPHPAVLFYMDAFGLRPAIDDWLRRIAAEGYVVLAPNMLYRSSRSPLLDDLESLMQSENRSKLFEQLRPMMALLTPENVVRDAASYLQALDRIPEAAKAEYGIVGYCMGAAAAFRTAAAYPDRFAALAAFHGGNLASEAETSPHRLIPDIRAQVYVAHADEDQSAPPEQQKRLEEALSSAGLTFQTEMYAGARHGFTMADTAAYHAPAAERHFRALTDLLGRTLRA